MKRKSRLEKLEGKVQSLEDTIDNLSKSIYILMHPPKFKEDTMVADGIYVKQWHVYSTGNLWFEYEREYIVDTPKGIIWMSEGKIESEIERQKRFKK